MNHPKEVERPWHDLGILAKLNELNFCYACDLLGIFADPKNIYVVTSLTSGGDLCNFSFNMPGHGKGREMIARPVAGQALAAVAWLHELGVAHRNLSLENMRFEDQGNEMVLKIIDFGQAVLERQSQGLAGKIVYRPPEMHHRSSYDPFLVDSFALGVVFYTMVAKSYPWRSTAPGKCDRFACASSYGLRVLMDRQESQGCSHSLLHVVSPEFVGFVEGLLALSPLTRLCLGESCYAAEITHGARQSAWDSKWLQNLRIAKVGAGAKG